MPLRQPGLPISSTIIILDISITDYSFSDIEITWAIRLEWVKCPACGAVGVFARHGLYYKYHYREKIAILRVRCRACRKTHALMPSFSLPGTSIGTEEAERYLLAREKGLSRAKAAVEFLDRGVSSTYPKHLERMLKVAVDRGKALFPKAADNTLSALEWVRAVCGLSERPLLTLNRYCLEHKTNPLCFCRASILQFGRTCEQAESSQTLDSAASGKDRIDSG